MKILDKMLGRFKESPEPEINYSENTQIWQARINNCKSTEELAELFQEFQHKLNTVSNYVVLLALIGNKFHQLGVTLRVTDRGFFMDHAVAD